MLSLIIFPHMVVTKQNLNDALQICDSLPQLKIQGKVLQKAREIQIDI